MVTSLAISSATRFAPSRASLGRPTRSNTGRQVPIPRCRASESDVACSKSLIEKVTDAASKCLIGATAAAMVLTPATFSLPDQLIPQAEARKSNLPGSDPKKNAKGLLRDALPIDNKQIRMIQRELESVAEALRVPGSKALGPVQRSVRKAESILRDKRQNIVADLAEDKAEAGMAAISGLEAALAEFDDAIAREDKQEVPLIQQKCLDYVGDIEEAMVKKFPFEVPAEYSNLPQLKGRATIQVELKFNKATDNIPGGSMTIVVDGYSAPITSGNFVDLVNRGFYNGMDVQRADGFVVQTGDPEGPAVGFVDPRTKETRTIPLEVLVEGDKEPTYGDTLEDLGRFTDQPVLPFNAFGTLAMARAETDANSASSQIFFLLKESELTPSGANLLDGRYAVFGYITEGADLLTECNTGDKFVSMKVTKGLENLQLPDTNAMQMEDGQPQGAEATVRTE